MDPRLRLPRAARRAVLLALGAAPAAALVLALALLAPAARASDADTCLGCHADKDAIAGVMTGSTARAAKLVVDTRKLTASVHKDRDCAECHQDLAGVGDFPHAPELQAVDCGSCHDKEQRDHLASRHGQAIRRGDKLAPTCKTCHGAHDVLSPKDPRAGTATMNVPQLCGGCHHEGSEVSRTHEIPQDRILENYSESIHGEGLFKKGLTVTAVCTSCHSPHLALPHDDARSSTHRANVATTCTRCHSRIESAHRKVVEGRLWEAEPHKVPSCTECHAPHKVRRAAYPQGMATKDCLLCHGKKDAVMQRDGRTISLYVDEAEYNTSTHARVACAQCHAEVRESLGRACATIKNKVDCAACHAGEVQVYKESVHGRLAAKDDHDAPVCLDCHDRHATKSRNWPGSPTFPRNVPDLCARCHRAGEKAAKRIHGGTGDIVKSYQTSIHGVGLLESGLVVTATCADCHTAHGELPADDPNSTVSRGKLIDTCGKCHQGIVEVFKASIHGPGKAKNGKRLPVCEDCHTSHDIARTDTADFRQLMMARCGECHESEAETFFETYHGKVSQLGRAGAAKCYDCHGTHDIRPTDDPRSRLSRENVVDTCGKCHPGSHRRFAGYLTHATHHDKEKYPALFFAFWGMTTLLVGTLAGATVHTGAWLWRLFRTRDQWSAHKATAHTGRLVQRFTAKQRVMHLTMMLSFFTLAITGMSLKFSYMRWAQAVSDFFGGSGAMGGMHRVAAVVLMALFAYHLYDLYQMKKTENMSLLGLIFNPNGLMFTWTDVKEIFGSIRWFFGLGPRPKYGRYTYWEKFDYFAVFWGVAVIGSTGLVLWFPEIFTRLLPGWSVNLATIIHSDEALLAVAFIFTVHFFNTHFRPDKFPMDPVIFTGSVPLEELKYDKPREYEQLVESGKLEERIVPPTPTKVERGFRIFGFTALGIGLTLVALIVYSMIFAYR